MIYTKDNLESIAIAMFSLSSCTKMWCGEDIYRNHKVAGIHLCSFDVPTWHIHIQRVKLKKCPTGIYPCTNSLKIPGFTPDKANTVRSIT